MSYQMPKKFIGKRMYEIDSRDLCIECIKVHKRKNIGGVIDVMTSEPGGTPLVSLHMQEHYHMLNPEHNMYVERFWFEFIELIKEFKQY